MPVVGKLCKREEGHEDNIVEQIFFVQKENKGKDHFKNVVN